MRPDEAALECFCRRSLAEEAGERVGDGCPVGRPRVEAERDLRGVPEQERRHDPCDEREDEVGLAEVTPFEPLRPLDLSDPERRDDSHQHEHREDVDHERVPALALEPPQRGTRRQRGLAIDDRDDRQEDRREEDDEAPEDERMDEAGPQALQELPLPEHDRRLVTDADREVGHPVDRLARPHEAGEEERAAREEPAGDRDRGDERDRGCEVHEPLAFRSSAEIAGTTSCRSPMTA